MKKKTSWRRPQLGKRKIEKQVSVCFKFSQGEKKKITKKESLQKRRITKQKKKNINSLEVEVKVKVTQSRPTLCDPME